MTAFPHRELLAIYRSRFELFATKAFRVVNPSQKLNVTGAFLAMAHVLGQVEAGSIRRLLITVPPRSGKSLLASIALPAFVLGRDPAQRIICASYSGELSGKISRDCRMLMASPEYRSLFPATLAAGKTPRWSSRRHMAVSASPPRLAARSRAAAAITSSSTTR